MTKRMTDRVAANSHLFAFGERGLLVQFNETEKTPAIRAVTTLNQQLLALKLRGLISTTPSYASLLVTFEPATISGDRLSTIISELLQSPSSDAMNLGPEIDQACWQLPTLFADNCDEEARALQEELGLSWDRVITTFCNAAYRVNAIGFLPGFTYLGGLSEALYCRRLEVPKIRIPASSVAIAGNQAGIYPMDSPGGWRVLGRLPFTIFEPARPSPVLFSPHDQVTFVSVSTSYFNELLASAEHGELRLDDFKQ